MSWFTMIAELTSTKSFRFIIAVVPMAILLFIIGDKYFNMHSTIPAQSSCVKTYENLDYCNFTCSFKTGINAQGRVLVTHTSWASIFETRFNTTANTSKYVEIQLPRRTFGYYMRGAFWGKLIEGDYEYGTVGTWLYC